MNPQRLPDSWFDMLHNWRKENSLSWEDVGEMAAQAIGRSRPFSRATVHRYFARQIVTEDLTEGLALILEVASPVASFERPEHQEWYQLGLELDSLDPKLFTEELDDLRELVALVRRRRKRRRK